HLDIVFAPMMFAAFGSLALAEAHRLWTVDALLTRIVERVASRPSALEGRAAGARLASGLRLLDIVLPLDEAVIFRRDESGAVVQAARLRASTQTAATHAEGDRNSAWREGVEMCERAITSGEMVVRADGLDAIHKTF